MALDTPRRSRRSEARRRRASGEGFFPAAPVHACGVNGCPEPGRATCPRCSRAVCLRHGGLTRSGAKSRGVNGPAAPRCALCRLEERRRSQSTLRRVWWGVSALGFAVFAGFAIRNNARQGLALLALALVIVVAAVFYDRMLRRS